MLSWFRILRTSLAGQLEQDRSFLSNHSTQLANFHQVWLKIILSGQSVLQL